MDRAVIDALASLELDVFQQSLEQLGVRSCMDVLYVTHLMDEDLIQIGLNLVQIRQLQFHILKTLRKNSVPVHDAEAVPVHAEGRLGLGRLSPEEVKQMIGEQLFPKVSKIEPDNAAKITGMMLEMGNKELLILLDSEQQLKMMVDDALRCLQRAQMAKWSLSSMMMRYSSGKKKPARRRKLTNDISSIAEPSSPSFLHRKEWLIVESYL